jgi:23S rRNA (adenine2503-C2)-methyltransferase
MKQAASPERTGDNRRQTGPEVEMENKGETMQKKYLPDMDINELEVFLQEMRQQKYRARQVFAWIARGAADFDEMTDLSKQLRQDLKHFSVLSGLYINKKLVSKIDGTVKYLFGLRDGNIIESVLMKYQHGYTACISSQVGCKMGCGFCASAIAGFRRNLSAGEMLEQVTAILRDSGIKVGNVVIMGIGEPFDNYDNVIKFLRLAHAAEGLNIGYRHMTVSTCGLVPYILRFSEENMQVNLAVSLHAPNDLIRSSIMPVGRKYSIDKIIEACKIYTGKTGRRVTFEYALIRGTNDSPENAAELASRLKGLLCHVNLIPVNSVKGTCYRQSRRESIENFSRLLMKSGIETTIRRELGSDIEAACGQLRRSELCKDFQSGLKDADTLRFAAESDRGLVREINEDCYRIIKGSSRTPFVFIVADGMGGHNCGEIASRMTVEYISDAVEQGVLDFGSAEDMEKALNGIVKGANKAVIEASLEQPETSGMGTTMTMAVIYKNTVTVAHVGDSRVYLVRAGNIRQLTEDHSYIGELVRNGTITREEAKEHPSKHVITRAIGSSTELEADIVSLEYEKDDIFVLCTDGLTNKLEEDEILDMVVGNEPAGACAKLVNAAKSKGGEDNITVIVIKIG